MDNLTFTACKHLSYDREKYEVRMKMNMIMYYGDTKVVWDRPTPDGRFQLCQFCNMRGRINDAIGCLSEKDKHCNDYELFSHVIPFTDIAE